LPNDYVAKCPLAELQSQSAAAGAVATLVPEMVKRVPKLPHAAGGGPETERYRLFESVNGLLSAATSDVPLLLILDDLHWAGRPSLLLLRHIMRGAGHARLMFLGTYRETDLARTHPLAEMLADLRREQGYKRIALRGLDESGVDALVGAWAGHEA
jgi:predicted ATPase